MARARCGLCDFVFGEALGLLPLAFEGARCFGLEGGGCVGIGAGGHCGGRLLLDDCDSDAKT